MIRHRVVHKPVTYHGSALIEKVRTKLYRLACMRDDLVKKTPTTILESRRVPFKFQGCQEPQNHHYFIAPHAIGKPIVYAVMLM